MPSAYSIDLRTHVVAAYRRDEGTQDSLAGIFGVSLTSVERWLRREREEGDVAARPHGGGQEDLIADEDLAAFKLVVEANADANQDELATIWSATVGEAVSRSTISRTLARAGITRKKRLSARASGTDRTSSRSTGSTSRRLPSSTQTGSSFSTRPG